MIPSKEMYLKLNGIRTVHRSSPRGDFKFLVTQFRFEELDPLSERNSYKKWQKQCLYKHSQCIAPQRFAIDSRIQIVEAFIISHQFYLEQPMLGIWLLMYLVDDRESGQCSIVQPAR